MAQANLEIDISDVAVDVLYNTFNLDDAIQARSTCSFVVRDDAGAAHYVKGQPVVVYNLDTGMRLFSGVIDKHTESKWPGGTLLLHTVQCVDNHYYADKRVAAKSYVNQSVQFVVNDLLVSYLRAEGVLGLTDAPTFTRATTAYNSAGVQVTSGNPRFDAGPFGHQSMWIEESTTNLYSANQSSWETDTTGATLTNSSGTATMTRDGAKGWNGVASLKFAATGAVGHFDYVLVTLPQGSFVANNTYALSFYIRGSGQIYCVWCDGNGAQFDGAQSAFGFRSGNPLTDTGWTRVVLTFNPGATIPATGLGLKIVTETANVAFTAWIDGLQIEQKPYATQWQLGGTTRNSEQFTLPIPGMVNLDGGSVDVYMYVDATARHQDSTGLGKRVVCIPNNSGQNNRGIQFTHSNTAATWVLQVDQTAGTGPTASVSDSVTPDGWHLFTLTWDKHAAVAELYIDGRLKATINVPNWPTGLGASNVIGIGHDASTSSSGGSFPDARYAGVRVSNRRRTAAECLALWNTNDLPTMDDATVYLMPLDGNLNVTTSITQAAVLQQVVFNYIHVAACFDALAQSAQGIWWIDRYKTLHVQAIGTSPATWNVVVDGNGVANDLIASSVKVDHGNPNYRNTQFIIGGQDTTATQTETRKGDSNTTAWAMGFQLATVPTITVNAVAKTVGIKGIDTGKDFYWSKGDSVITQDSAGTKLISTDTLSVTYTGLYDIVAVSSDTAAIIDRQNTEGGGTGIVEDVAQANNLTDKTAALQLASSKIAMYAKIGRTLTYTTNTDGLRPGMLQFVTLPPHGCNNDDFLIESVRVRDIDGILYYDIKAIEGPVEGSWEQVFAQLAPGAKAQDSISLGSSTILTLQQSVNETWTWGETVTPTVNSCTLPDVSVYPSTSVYPC